MVLIVNGQFHTPMCRVHFPWERRSQTYFGSGNTVPTLFYADMGDFDCTRGFIFCLKFTKIVSSWQSPDPAEGAYSAPKDSYSGHPIPSFPPLGGEGKRGWDGNGSREGREGEDVFTPNFVANKRCLCYKYISFSEMK